MERLPVPKLAVKIVKVIYFFMKNVYDFYCLTYTDIMLLSTWLRPTPHFYCTNGQLGLELETNLCEVFTTTENAPTTAFSWLKAPTITFTFKTISRHYAKRVLTHSK